MSESNIIDLRIDRYSDVHTRKIWSEMTKDRNYRCPICLKQNIEANFVLDHNHKTGEIRNVICRSCNYTLHYVEDLKGTAPEYTPFYNYLKQCEHDSIELSSFYNDLQEVL